MRWRRIPGRLILAACFLVGAAALVYAVLPFTSTTDDGVELRCGPAVFEVLMPPDPDFDDVPENAGCASPASRRMVVSGAALGAALVVAGITEWRTRRGSIRRDTAWLATSPSTKRRASEARRRRRASAKGSAGKGSRSTGKRSDAGEVTAGPQPGTTALPGPRR